MNRPGSRARSREIGYAQACLDLSHQLRGTARSWREYELFAVEEGNWSAAVFLGLAATMLEERTQLADAMFEIYSDDRPPQDPRSAIGWRWGRSEAPHETGDGQ